MKQFNFSVFFNFFGQRVPAYPLVVFRIAFGAMMFFSVIRFWIRGWISELYIKPTYYFSYQGLEWIKPLPGMGMYIVFLILAIAALVIAFGLFYKYATVLFFLLFTYIELMDKTNYLNHYYFISIISFLLCLVPANRFFSLDVYLRPQLRQDTVPNWCISIFQWQLSLVYIFAAISKINSDWLLEAMPLRIWLPAQSHLPVIGWLLLLPATAYVFSWAGMLFDLTIPFFLFRRQSRPWAYGAVVIFHLCTLLLFQIGMFPLIMIASTLIFFSAEFHKKIISGIALLLRIPYPLSNSPVVFYKTSPVLIATLIIHFAIQIILPFRYLMYPGRLFWNEEGYRFSWRVMLMEKAGYATFIVRDSLTGKSEEVCNRHYLTQNQEKMMATQPDMILQYAHHLANIYTGKGFHSPQVFTEDHVVLNGKGSRLFIDPSVNLAAQKENFGHKPWILDEDAPANE